MVSYTVSPDDVIRKSKVVAVVGASKTPGKEAFTVPLYLMQHGFTVIPINPTTNLIHGIRAYPSLADLSPELAESVEIVEVFRPSEELPEIARQVAKMKNKTKKTPVFWAQLGLESEEAKQILKESGVPYVMNVCMRTQHQLLRGAR